jgi:hypothetical protein
MMTIYRFALALLLVLVLVMYPCRQAEAQWQGVSDWQGVQWAGTDTFIHLIVGDAIGTLIQAKFNDEDRRAQFIKAMGLALMVGLTKEIYDAAEQSKHNKPFNFPDSVKDLAMNFLGVFISFKFDFGAVDHSNDKAIKKVREEFYVSLNSTPESVSLRTDGLCRNLDFTISK